MCNEPAQFNNWTVVPREKQKAVLLLSDGGAQRSWFNKSSSGIKHIQTFVSTFVLAKNETVVAPFLGYSTVLLDYINKGRQRENI